MRILLAEDEKALSDVLVAILKKNNYSVDAVYDGQEAIDYAETNLYDVVLLDVMMPKKDGLEVVAHLRARKNNVPVIMLTAKTQTEDKIIGLDSGADDYITKPFEMKELLARIRAVARRRNPMTDSILSFGNVRLNRSTYELCVAEEKIRLGHKEFQIMETLMEYPSNVFSTERFMEKIWGYDSDVDIGSVWVYISFLRKKLLQLGANIQIKANRNIGYSLELIHD